MSQNFFNFNNNSIIVYNRRNEKRRIKKKLLNFTKMLKSLESIHLQSHFSLFVTNILIL